ncbi:transposase [Singulisphaera sp. Ch08]|uniref:Transposase n=1 Tax=Singulisphaera sp. Ch08 TaxID=3120278 RepID=A0AAU7CN84_9BACT
MNLTLRLRLLPNGTQTAKLLAVMERFNEAATFAAQVAFEAKVYSQPSIHKLAYRAIRDRFGLSAQLAVRAIGKAVETFRRDKTVGPVFKSRGAVTYDERILSFKGLDKVSLTTLDGREVIAMVFGEYQGARFDRIKGQVDLVYHAGQFHLYATIKVPEDPGIEIRGFLGVDLGIVNLATDSDGNVYTGEPVEKTRQRNHGARRSFQKTGTKSAKRRLKKIAKREAHFRRNENHVISKRLVALAKDTDRGIGLEDLKHIRDRITVRAKDRAKHSGWAFGQLLAFVTYKATLAGVPVLTVDARNTSRTCNVCGDCEKSNRKNQAEFLCKHCGHSENADRNAARNIRDRATLRWPDLAAGVDPRLKPSGNLVASPRL